MAQTTPTLREAVREATYLVRPGRQGWMRRLQEATDQMQPHMSVGRVRVYQELIQALKNDLGEYAVRKRWPSSWKNYCEDRLSEFFDFYVTIPIQRTKCPVAETKTDSVTSVFNFRNFLTLCYISSCVGFLFYNFM